MKINIFICNIIYTNRLHFNIFYSIILYYTISYKCNMLWYEQKYHNYYYDIRIIYGLCYSNIIKISLIQLC